MCFYYVVSTSLYVCRYSLSTWDSIDLKSKAKRHIRVCFVLFCYFICLFLFYLFAPLLRTLKYLVHWCSVENWFLVFLFLHLIIFLTCVSIPVDNGLFFVVEECWFGITFLFPGAVSCKSTINNQPSFIIVTSAIILVDKKSSFSFTVPI